MNNYPKNIDVSFLKKKTLIQICIGENEIVLNFQGNAFDNASITVESDIGVAHKGGTLQSFDDVDPTYIAASAMAEFLGKDINEVIYKGDGSLTLVFENGDSILLYNNKEHYVSYTIHYKDQGILI